MTQPAPAVELLGEDGPLAARLGSYEHRESQLTMAAAVEDALREGTRLLVEAGPGTGKSFAYLVPAIQWARHKEGRIVVSTWTRNLQEQIVFRDLPFLTDALGADVGVALVQGRENYLCQRRAHEAAGRWQMEGRGAPVDEIARILHGVKKRGHATNSDLDFRPSSEVWSSVRAERGNCLVNLSPYFHGCGWQDARRRAREASILVVNHALLMADLRLRRTGASVLPAYQCLIIDEAHHLEQVAADHLGVRVTRAAVLGFLRSLREYLGTEMDAVGQLEVRCRDLATEFFEAWEGRIEAGAYFTIRHPEPAPELSQGLVALQHALKDRALHAESPSQEREWNSRIQRCLTLETEIHQVLAGVDPEQVCWVERDQRQGVVLCAAPIDPAPILAKELFQDLATVVMTSATLASSVRHTEDEFEYVRVRTGVGEAPGLKLSSPFDYTRQASVLIDLLPEPKQASVYEEAMAERIPVHVSETRGRSFVLFTSRRTMNAVVKRCRETFEEHGILVLVQGEQLSRHALLERFRHEQPAVLFGLASFWEGVDVPGDDLSQVVLTRLPFAVPDHPRDQARAARVKNQGGDPFSELSLPHAVLRWKQGFGRLIRSRDDRGRVTVLDSRVLTRPWGRRFLEALPECPRFVWKDGDEYALE